MPNSTTLIKTDEIITLLKAVANIQRFTTIKALISGEKNVGELESCITLSQSALSQHLARLRRDNIVQTRREAQQIYYSLNNDNVVSLMKYLDGLPTRAQAY